ncbi:MAG TPA: ribosome maturation factor RimM [Candidatus Methylomirabilis sp.]|nr:ribosome maturation factor RimM [Candidatus Methylomirabilis sp.]
MAPPHYLILGRIVKAHGVRGEVKVVSFADTWHPFRTLARLWVGPPGGPLRLVSVEAGHEHGRDVLLKLQGVDSPEAASRLIGQELSIPRAEAPEPPEGSFYHHDILGLLVVEGERPLGCVREILETPAHDVFVVQAPAGEWLLPATRAHIRRVDLPAGRIEIEPMTGLVSPSAGGEESPEAI